MAEEQNQDATASTSTDMSQQISNAIQPIIGDLQEQITKTVRQQLNQTGASVGANGTGALSLDSLGPLGETLQSSVEDLIDRLQPFYQWVIQMLQKLVNWVMSLVNGEGDEQEAEGSEA
jgi:hypothetical protein